MSTHSLQETSYEQLNVTSLTQIIPTTSDNLPPFMYWNSICNLSSARV